MVSLLPPRPSSIPQAVWSRIGRNLHDNPVHPIGIIRNKIESFFLGLVDDCNRPRFVKGPVPVSPIVSVDAAFNSLLVPKDHCLRSTSDTYYVSPDSTVLRPHATSHQREMLQYVKRLQEAGADSPPQGTIWTCDVYRKDEVDRIHFPVFHQTDGVCVFLESVAEDAVVKDLQTNLENLIGSLFHEAGMPLKYRWDLTATFPFTHPSMELEIEIPNSKKWMECLGCGKIRTEIHPNGWAFGMGIDRLAMLLFDIEDIRTFWSNDARFLDQFQEGKISQFKQFSKYPPIYRDTSFWLDKSRDFDLKNFAFDCMQRAGPYGLESVDLVDQFTKLDKVSRCIRFTYRGIEKTLSSDECNEVHNTVINPLVQDELGGVIR